MKFSSGTAINYGSILPPTTADGSLFFLTEAYTDTAGSSSNPSATDVDRTPGLHIYRFQQDSNVSTIGDQVGFGWQQLSTADVPVKVAGDTMTGGLTINTDDMNLQLSGVAPTIRFSETDVASGSREWLVRANGSQFTLFAANDALTTTTSLFNITRAGAATILGNTVWHAGNDGASSGLDADLLDGQQGSWYRDSSNHTGVITVARGGTNTTTVTAGGIVYGASASQYGSSAAGTAGQVLTANGTTAPTWINQSALAAGTAATLATARNIVLAGDVTGSVSFNGGADVTITTTVLDDSHAHTIYVQKAGDTVTGPLIVSNTTNATSASTGAFRVSAGGASVAQDFWVGGQINSIGDIAAYASDARLKKNIRPIANAVEKVVSLGGYVYDWDLDKTRPLGFKPSNPTEHGLIAQDVQKVMPDAVAKAPFNEEYLTVKYERIVALLVAAVREQQSRIDKLEALLAAKGD